MTTRLHIDRLILENVPAAQRPALLRAFRAELARSLAQPPAGPAPASLPAAPSPSAAGQSAARVVARRIGGGA